MEIQPKRPSTRSLRSHLATWEGLGEGQQGPETEWGAHLTDDEYNRS